MTIDPQHIHNVMSDLAAAWVGPCVSSSRRARLELNTLVLEGLEADDTGTKADWVERARVAYSTTNPDPSARFTVWCNAGGLTLSQRLPTVEAACGEVRRACGLLPEPAQDDALIPTFCRLAAVWCAVDPSHSAEVQTTRLTLHAAGGHVAASVRPLMGALSWRVTTCTHTGQGASVSDVGTVAGIEHIVRTALGLTEPPHADVVRLMGLGRRWLEDQMPGAEARHYELTGAGIVLRLLREGHWTWVSEVLREDGVWSTGGTDYPNLDAALAACARGLAPGVATAAHWTLTPNVTDPCPLALEAGALLVELVELLDRKNKAYGNSATQPLAVFSKLPAIDRLAVRIDDKLSRIGRGSEDAKSAVPEDTVLDLIGYLVIYLLESRKG